MNENFMRVYDIRTRTSCIININQIVWVDINAGTLMMSTSSDKGLFHLDMESIENIIKVIQKGSKK